VVSVNTFTKQHKTMAGRIVCASWKARRKGCPPTRKADNICPTHLAPLLPGWPGSGQKGRFGTGKMNRTCMDRHFNIRDFALRFTVAKTCFTFSVLARSGLYDMGAPKIQRTSRRRGRATRGSSGCLPTRGKPRGIRRQPLAPSRVLAGGKGVQDLCYRCAARPSPSRYYLHLSATPTPPFHFRGRARATCLPAASPHFFRPPRGARRLCRTWEDACQKRIHASRGIPPTTAPPWRYKGTRGTEHLSRVPRASNSALIYRGGRCARCLPCCAGAASRHLLAYRFSPPASAHRHHGAHCYERRGSPPHLAH